MKYGYLGKDQENGRRKYLLRKLDRYGITETTFEKLVERQGNSCAICGVDLSGMLHIDHDHQTGFVRGLLCDIHNRGLGHFDDNPDLLEIAAAYLRANS